MKSDDFYDYEEIGRLYVLWTCLDKHRQNLRQMREEAAIKAQIWPRPWDYVDQMTWDEMAEEGGFEKIHESYLTSARRCGATKRQLNRLVNANKARNYELFRELLESSPG